MQSRTLPKTQPLDIQESLKILRYRFGREVAFHPVILDRGVHYYAVDGKLLPESEILSMTSSGLPGSPLPQ